MDKTTAELIIELYNVAKEGYIYPCGDTGESGMSNNHQAMFTGLYKDTIIKAREVAGVCVHCGDELGKQFFGAGDGTGQKFQCTPCNDNERTFQL